MKTTYQIILTWTAFLLTASFVPKKTETCDCKNQKHIEKIEKMEFQTSVPMNPRIVSIGNFGRLSAEENKLLWFEEIQFPLKTSFTHLWNDYSPNNYRTSHADFIKYFKQQDNVDLAFQLGPNMDLWAYHTFTFKRLDSCFLAVRTYFRHARFTYKAYALMCPSEMENLFKIVNDLQDNNSLRAYRSSYKGAFQNNRVDTNFYAPLGLNHSDSTKTDTILIYESKVKELTDFVDDEIEWIISYN